MVQDKNSEAGQVLADVKDAGVIAGAVTKLTKNRVDVTFNERQNELDLLDMDEITIKANIGTIDKADTKLLEEANKALATIATKRAEIEATSVKAYVVPLSYRDARIVQTAITEAILSVEGMGFDDNAKIVMVMQERKMMTVYLTLRKLANYTERYFKTLEDIVNVSDRTIDKLYETYVKEFELTPDERKNS